MTKHTLSQPDHEQSMPLIPWLVNGTLDNDEAQALRQHIDSCKTCQRELASASELDSLLHDSMRSEPGNMTSAANSLAKMKLRISTESRNSAGSAVQRLYNSVGGIIAHLTLPQAIVAAVAVLSVVLLLSQSAPFSTRISDADYRVLGNDTPVEQVMLSVLFTPGLPDSAAIDILSEANTLSGLNSQWQQNESSMYTVTVTSTNSEIKHSPEVISAFITLLNDNQAVVDARVLAGQ